MCRHLAYLGPPATLSALLLEPPHSLLRQSWAPRDMRGGGTINADGFGVGWYPLLAAGGVRAEERSDEDGRSGPGPVRYRRAGPMWSDPGFPELARVTASGAVLAAVRSATVGMPVHESACAPFAAGDLLFSHNGRVTGWPRSVAKLAERLPVTDLLTLDAPTDAALLWALVRHRLRGGADPASALAATVSEVDAAAPGSRLNLLLTDGRRVYATTAGHSLSVRLAAGAVTVASEPYDDDPAWRPVPDRSLVVADPTTHTVEDL
ncbi:ergothioneine biosynthesis protein EgtC [Phytohabitans sp. ZYX-F-186]|uniref:Gamma-glutamyl-hercynylcysteine sulfoxide hydrolase n=1 Tax=Phytohabitans maris TaxID=3071409 RepID=A0ABU0ZQI6_9ACTN|nr:ergothioneine biosynthesis protein EgtC [Phytohabitans sp. ZYX-F-186]MDQ7909304.1 ergothioneine biosynthesis protein EgtC [Phytohabitans sp. ZYX-F-186]